MNAVSPSVSAEQIWAEYEKGIAFNEQINLYDTVRVNEDFFIGKQWEGVRANGLPTPVFNFIKRIILFLVASTATDNITMAASPMFAALPAMPSPQGADNTASVQVLCEVINAQFDALFEQNKTGALVRDFTRDAAVRGDACIYSWFDPDAETGQAAKGTIRTQILENTRVIFGNPNLREVEAQPFLIISRRERVEDVCRQAAENGLDPHAVRPDADEVGDRFDALSDGKVTTLTRFWRRDGGIWWAKCVRESMICPERDSGMRRYPIVWLCWDHVSNCYHGQAAVTGLIPNQIFVNKVFAMTMLSLMTTAFPKVVYDRSRVSQWDAGVGKAIPVNGGGVDNVAKTVDPAAVSPQIGQFIDLAVSMTKEFSGATDAALGNVKPENTSAIVALQKASSVPMELVKQDLFQAVEDLGHIWLDQMRAYYGLRYVSLPPSEEEKQRAAQLGFPLQDRPRPVLFDFSILGDVPLSLKLDVGGSAYWSEISQINTLENLLTLGKISTVDFLERMPNGYVSNQEELIETLKAREQAAYEQQAQARQAPADQPVL